MTAAVCALFGGKILLLAQSWPRLAPGLLREGIVAGNPKVTETEFRSWRAGMEPAWRTGRAKLTTAESWLARRRLVHFCATRNGDTCRVDLGAEWAVETALGITDLKVSGGRFAIVTGTEDGHTVHYIRNSARRVNPARTQMAVWRDEEAFHALFRDILQKSCLEVLREDRVHAGDERLAEPLPLPSDSEGNDTERGTRDTVTDSIAPEARLKLSAGSAAELVEALAEAAEGLRIRKQNAAADLLVTTMRYLKLAGWRAANPDSADAAPAPVLDGMTVEGIWNGGELDVDLDAAELEALLQGWASPAAFHKRRQRLGELLLDLPMTGRSWDVLGNWLDRLIAMEADRLINDAERWRSRMDGPQREALDTVAAYFKWLIACGHYRYQHHASDYYGIDLEDVRRRSAAELIGRRCYVSRWDPNAAGFREFLKRYRLLDGDLEQSGRMLIAGVQARSGPTTRLLPVLRELFLQEGGGDA